MKKIIAFDFDGVLCNSTEECMITGYNAWMEYKGFSTFINSKEEVPEDLAKYFRPLRGFVRTGGQYFTIFHSYKTKKMNDETDFNNACTKYKEEILEYEKLFFKCRNILRDKDINYWINLHTSYGDIPEKMKNILDTSNIYIVTGKDKDSVRVFLRSLEIDIPRSKIFDKNAAHNKVEALKIIAKKEKKLFGEIIFLDDNINHLLKPKKIGFNVYMAGWGYHCGEHLELARSNGVPILELNNWDNIIC